MIGLMNILVTVLIIALILGLLWWAFQQLPLPPMARTVLMVVIVIVCVIFLLSLLTGSVGWPVFVR